MTAALALAPVILQALPTIEIGAEQLWAWVTSVRTAAQQSTEWTDELEKQFRAALQATSNDAAYKPDASLL